MLGPVKPFGPHQRATGRAPHASEHERPRRVEHTSRWHCELRSHATASPVEGRQRRGSRSPPCPRPPRNATQPGPAVRATPTQANPHRCTALGVDLAEFRPGFQVQGGLSGFGAQIPRVGSQTLRSSPAPRAEGLRRPGPAHSHVVVPARSRRHSSSNESDARALSQQRLRHRARRILGRRLAVDASGQAEPSRRGARALDHAAYTRSSSRPCPRGCHSGSTWISPSASSAGTRSDAPRRRPFDDLTLPSA